MSIEAHIEEHYPPGAPGRSAVNAFWKWLRPMLRADQAFVSHWTQCKDCRPLCERGVQLLERREKVRDARRQTT